MNIFVGGSLREVPLNSELCQQFVQLLGGRIVERGHTLLTGCRGSLDQAVAEAAVNWLNSHARGERQQLVSYRLKKEQPVHRLGRIRISRREDWDLSHPELDPPEQIAEADATVFIAGSKGTFCAANWARIAEKPILGVMAFGGAGSEIFERERLRFEKRYAHFVAPEDFEILNQDTVDYGQLASDVVSLCEKIIASTAVFTIMPFTADFRDVYASYSTVCKEFGFTAQRTDESECGERIIPRILAGIRRSAFVIADVTPKADGSKPSANVFYEIGLAEGMGRTVIVTARKDTPLPFDIADVPIIFWSGQEDLKEKLRKRVKETASRIRKVRA